MNMRRRVNKADVEQKAGNPNVREPFITGCVGWRYAIELAHRLDITAGSPTMKLAFVVQTYSEVEQATKLIATLKRHDQYSVIVVSHDGSALQMETLKATAGVDHVIPSPGGRGRFTVIDGLISSMRWLLSRPDSFDWLVLLSGQDYPIRPLSDLKTKLAGTAFDGYFYHFDALDETQANSGPMAWPRSEVEDRYLFRYGQVKPFTSRLDRAVLKVPRRLIALSTSYRLETNYGLGLGSKPASTPFGPDFALIGGNYWMTINRRCVETVVDFVDERPDITAYFRDVVVPEEAFLQTVLVNDRRLVISPAELRYFDFTNSSHGRPRTLGGRDIAALRESGCYFARKFDEAAEPGILNLIDEQMLRVGGGLAIRGELAS